MDAMNLFGGADSTDNLAIPREDLEAWYRVMSYDAEEYVDMFDRFPEADTILPWLCLYTTKTMNNLTERQVKRMNSLSLKEKKQVADVLAKAFCGEEFILPRERQWAEMIKKDGMKLVEIPVMERVAALRLIAVKQNGMALQYCGGMPLATEAALIQNGLALQYMDDQESYEYFLAIRQNPEAATFVTNEEVLAKCHGDLTFLVNHLDEISVEIYSKNR